MTLARVFGNGDLKMYVSTYLSLRTPATTTPIQPNPVHKKTRPKTTNLPSNQINSSLPSTTTSPTHKPVILIDVREPAELSSTGIIPSALSIPLASQPDALYLTPDEFETRFGFPKPAVDAESNLVFYCKAGVRARAAAQLAVQAGYDPEKVGVYEGSWLDWEKRGGKVERWEGDDA